MSAGLRRLRNVGPATVQDFGVLGITEVAQLLGQDAFELHDRLCTLTGERHDPCMIDVFMSAIDQAQGGAARDWWHYTPERKRRLSL
jgi:hypothetical protein